MDELLARPLGVGSFLLSESPVVLGQELVFVDLEGRALLRYRWADRRLTRTVFAQRVCCAVPVAGGGLLLALETRLERLAGDGSRTVVSNHVPAGVRLNDGGCDGRGRFFVGTTGYDREPGMGALHRLDGDRLVTVLDGLTLPNGLGWSPDGRRFYLVDSVARQVLVHAYDPTVGAVGERLAVVDVAHLSGYPDGLAVDTDGNLWVAFWNGAAVRCLGPAGELRHEVRLPVPDPTSCVFRAPGTLVITTARGDGTVAGAGDLFQAQVPAAGLGIGVWQP